MLFLSDVAQELDAAASAGMLTCQLLRPQDGTVASTSHAHAESFAEVQVEEDTSLSEEKQAKRLLSAGQRET